MGNGSGDTKPTWRVASLSAGVTQCVRCLHTGNDQLGKPVRIMRASFSLSEKGTKKMQRKKTKIDPVVSGKN